MKKASVHTVLFCLLLLIVGCMTPTSASGQSNQPDTLSLADLDAIAQPRANVLEFDIIVYRVSEWKRWANGTFQFYIADFDLSDCSFEFIPGTTDLDLSKYTISALSLPSRFSVYVLGPEQWIDCIDPQSYGDKIKVGRFRLTAPEGRQIPYSLMWKEPVARYQALAHKLVEQEGDFVESDNVEMATRSVFRSHSDSFELEVVDFSARYVGRRRVELLWTTLREYDNAGFILFRGIRPFGDLDNSNVQFEQVASYETSPELVGLGTVLAGKQYRYEDLVDLRGEQYIYKLERATMAREQVYVSTASVIVPNSVITWAQAEPNPFVSSTEIPFLVDDDVYLTVEIFDAQGKRVQRIYDNVEVYRGRESEFPVRFVASEVAPQGVYTAIFSAIPIDDTSLDYSTAVVKMQLVR